jgi:hypothetical protein
VAGFHKVGAKGNETFCGVCKEVNKTTLFFGTSVVFLLPSLNIHNLSDDLSPGPNQCLKVMFYVLLKLYDKKKSLRITLDVIMEQAIL